MVGAPPAGLVGRALGDFVVREPLGEGAHGVVHRAEQRGLAREAVIKILRGQRRGDDRAVQRFLREAQLASRLDHPYAAHVYAFGAEPDGLLWIAMELVRGTPLSQWLAAQPGGRAPAVRWVPLLERVCEVVHSAHEQGIVHRDLKPDNIMVISRAGRLLPKLLDLGVAKLALDGAALDGAAPAGDAADAADARLTRDGARVGSPYYMAPEQWRAEEVDARADIYALGVVTYQALVGRVPFDGASVAQLAAAHRAAPLPPAPDALSPALAAALAAATAKARDDRPATALAFAAAVRAAAGLRPVADALPRLDDELRRIVAWFPQPLADAIGALDAARNPHQARDVVWELVAAAARWLGVLAVAARGQLGPGPGERADAPEVVEALQRLGREDLDVAAWWSLTRALARPFAPVRDAYPVPALVELARREVSPFAALLDHHAADVASTSEESLREWLARTLPLVAELVRALEFLRDYQLVAARADAAELWMGPRAARRQLLRVDGALAPGTVALVDLDARPVLTLSPLAMVAAAAPGGDDELFVFAGPGRARGWGARLVAEPEGFERHEEAVWAWFRAAVLTVETGVPAALEAAPYLGLAPFAQADAARFFGRERQAEAFANQLLVTPVLALVGPSGAGKSSFVQAGVLPLLPPSWRAIVLRPGPSPLAHLRARAGATIAADDGEHVVIVVDQFEELFTLGADADARHGFAAALADAARAERVHVVLTLRDDFLVRAGELEPLRDALASSLVLLGTPAPAELRRIVVEPARRAGYDFDDPELPARMVQTVAGRPGALALLSFTATRLWELRDRHFKRLTRKAYDAIGGIEGALAAHAEATLGGAGADEQRLVREAFRHLVTAEGTRAALTRDELEQILGRTAAARAVIERWVQARLLVVAEDAEGGERIELVHEALIAAWPRLAEWRRADAEGARLRDQLRTAARQWDERGRAEGLLWRGDALDDYRRWRARWAGALPAVDEAFAATSLAAADRSRRRRRALTGGAAAVLIVATLALALLYRASRRNADEARARLVASYVEQGRRLLVDGDYLRALPYLAAAYQAGDDDLALRVMLHRALRLADTPVLPVAASDAAFRGADAVLAVDLHGEMSIRELASGRIVARVAPALAAAAPPREGAVSDDGARAAFPADDAVLLWDGDAVRRLPVAGARAVAFDRRGARLAVADGQMISVWDAATGRRVAATAHAAPTDELAWCGDALIGRDTDGATFLIAAGAAAATPLAPSYRLAGGSDAAFATIGDDAVDVWGPGGARLRTLEVASAYGGAISRDGHSIAVVAHTGTIQLFDVATGRALGVLAGHRGPAHAAFTPDGARLVTVGDDRSVRIWDVAARSLLFAWGGAGSSPFALRLDGAAGRVVVATAGGVGVYGLRDPGALAMVDTGAPVYAATFAQGGARVFTTSDRGVALWDAARGDAVARLDVGPGFGSSIEPSGGRAVVPLDGPHGAQLFALDTGAAAGRLAGATALTATAFDRDGARVATATPDGAIDVWGVGGEHRASLPGHHGKVLGLAFSPDGRRLAAAGYADATLLVWDAAAGRVLASATEPDSLSTVAYDGTGRTLVTAGDDGHAVLWDARTLRRLRSFDHEAVVRAAAVDPTAALVAGATRDGRVVLWDVASGEALTQFRHAAIVMGVDFAPDGARLTSGGLDGRVAVWDVASDVPPPAAVAATVACRVPFELRGTTLEPRTPTPCGPTTARP